MSHDHDAGIFEDTVERRDELLLRRSIHCKLFPVWRPASVAEPPVATCHPVCCPHSCTQQRRTTFKCPAPETAWSPPRYPRFEPVARRPKGKPKERPIKRS